MNSRTQAKQTLSWAGHFKPSRRAVFRGIFSASRAAVHGSGAGYRTKALSAHLHLTYYAPYFPLFSCHVTHDDKRSPFLGAIKRCRFSALTPPAMPAKCTRAMLGGSWLILYFYYYYCIIILFYSILFYSILLLLLLLYDNNNNYYYIIIILLLYYYCSIIIIILLLYYYYINIILILYYYYIIIIILLIYYYYYFYYYYVTENPWASLSVPSAGSMFNRSSLHAKASGIAQENCSLGFRV